MKYRSRFRFSHVLSRSIAIALLILYLLPICTSTCGAEEKAKAVGEIKTRAAATSARETEDRPRFDFSRFFPNWMRADIFGISLWQFLVAFIFILLGLAAKKISDYIFEKKVIPFLAKTRFAFERLLATAANRPLGYLFLLGGIYAAFATLVPTESNVRDFIFGSIKVLVVGDVLWFLFRVVDAIVESVAKLTRRTGSKLDEQFLLLIRRALKVTVGVVCFLWVVQILGLKVSSLLAGLGIGGLAVALAMQDTLANLFGSVFIFLDRPFGIKDWIRVGDVEGAVEDIGFRSTRIRTAPGTLVSIPNKTVAAANVDNWSRMPKRRVMQTIGVTYETSPEDMEKAVAALRDIVENDPGVDRNSVLVRFTEFGESSLNILLLYFTRTIAFADHLTVKERVNLAIMRKLRDLGLSMAFPTRTVYFEGTAAKGLAPRLSHDQEGRPET